MRKLIILYLLTFISECSIAQTTFIGGGFTLSYKSTFQESGAMIYSRIKNKFDAYAGYSINGNWNGQGFAGGLRWIILNRNIQPFIGVSTSYNFGRQVNLNSDNVKGVYKVGSNSFIYEEAGVMFRIIQKDPDNITKYNLTTLLILNVTYRQPISNASIKFIEGDYTQNAQHNLENRIGQGFGGGISLVFQINKKKKV